MKETPSKDCIVCGKSFIKKNGISWWRWGKAKYCSHACFGKADGESRLELYKDKTKHPRWKGDNVGYFALHDWVEKVLGKPKRCVSCGLCNQNRVYHWANLSGKYKRREEDWARMCVPCHRRYDYARKTV